MISLEHVTAQLAETEQALQQAIQRVAALQQQAAYLRGMRDALAQLQPTIEHGHDNAPTTA